MIYYTKDMRRFVREFDTTADQWAGRLPRRLYPLFYVASASGLPIVMYGIAAVLFAVGWTNGIPLLRFAAYMIVVTHVTSSLLKVLFSRSRPLAYRPGKWTMKTYSFPSGHAAGSSVAYGALAVAALYLHFPMASLVATLVLVWVVVIGVSRIYLGAHYASDVIGGWCLGVIFLMISFINPVKNVVLSWYG